MRTRTTCDYPPQLEGIRRRFDRWRRTRPGRSRIPAALWTSAVTAARKYGLARTVRVLRLDYASLKKRVEAGVAHRGPEREAVAGFVELTPALAGGSGECIVELDHPGGSKMRVQLKGVEPPDLTALSQSFWSMRVDHRPSRRPGRGRGRRT